MFKYKLNQEVWFIRNNKLCSSIILSRQCIDNAYPTWQRFQKTHNHKTHLAQFGNECIKYATEAGIFTEQEITDSKESLLCIEQFDSVSILENFEFSEDFFDINN